jgi:hypothetical protein
MERCTPGGKVETAPIRLAVTSLILAEYPWTPVTSRGIVSREVCRSGYNLRGV